MMNTGPFWLRKFHAILWAISGGFLLTAHGQDLATWNFYSGVSSNAQIGSASLASAIITYGTMVPFQASSHVGASYYGNAPTHDTNLPTALAQDQYFQISLNPSAGQSVTVTGFTFNMSAFSGHPANYIALFSSADGYNITNQIGSSLFITSYSQSAPAQISFEGFTNVITNLTTYRFYMYGSAGSNNVYFGNSSDSSAKAITVNTIPEAKTAGLVTLGLIALAFFAKLGRRRRPVRRLSPNFPV